MKKLLLGIFVVVAALVGLPVLRGAPVDQAIAAEASPGIELYSAAYCGECKRAKTYMKDKGIKFVDYDIENDIDKRREFYARGGIAIPLFFIHGMRMEGFDVPQFEALRARES